MLSVKFPYVTSSGSLVILVRVHTFPSLVTAKESFETVLAPFVQAAGSRPGLSPSSGKRTPEYLQLFRVYWLLGVVKFYDMFDSALCGSMQ